MRRSHAPIGNPPCRLARILAWSCPLLDALEYLHHIFHLLMEFPSSTRQDEQPSTKEDEVTQ